MRITKGLKTWFGLNAEKRALPAGWEYEESPQDFLRVRDPAGMRYLVGCQEGEEVLYPKIGPSARGQHYLGAPVGWPRGESRCG